MPDNTLKNKRSMTGNHHLLPASRPHSSVTLVDLTARVPTYSLITWTFGRGSVIWRIWPAVLLHTLFAAAVVSVSLQEVINLEIPNVMLTVLGVVIGFVISYRAISGYERYWMGRTCWSDVIRNCRTLGRFFWFHVPPRLTPKTPEEISSGELKRPIEELNKVMAEKRMALDLIEGFAVALKHHIRGEPGIYYEDLYHLVQPMHEHSHTADNQHEAMTTAVARKSQRITAAMHHVKHHVEEHVEHNGVHRSHSPTLVGTSAAVIDVDPVIPSINDYGTFDPNKLSSRLPAKRNSSQESLHSNLSDHSQHQPLLPSAQPRGDGTKVSRDLIPFFGIFASLLSKRRAKKNLPPDVQDAPEEPTPDETEPRAPDGRLWDGPVGSDLEVKHRPTVAGGGENLPLEIVRCLSEWCSVLEDRGTVPGTSMGTMIAVIASFEDSLSALERILTTPLPFVYSVHIRHTVWLYLFFLPFQLVSQFGYYTIPGVAIAAFIYLGFLAAGEEMEQPFGYDANDLDLELFCRAIIHKDIKHLKASPCLNAYFAPTTEELNRRHPHRTRTLNEISDIPIVHEYHEVALDPPSLTA